MEEVPIVSSRNDQLFGFSLNFEKSSGILAIVSKQANVITV